MQELNWTKHCAHPVTDGKLCELFAMFGFNARGLLEKQGQLQSLGYQGPTDVSIMVLGLTFHAQMTLAKAENLSKAVCAAAAARRGIGGLGGRTRPRLFAVIAVVLNALVICVNLVVVVVVVRVIFEFLTCKKKQGEMKNNTSNFVARFQGPLAVHTEREC